LAVKVWHRGGILGVAVGAESVWQLHERGIFQKWWHQIPVLLTDAVCVGAKSHVLQNSAQAASI
jgi:hypothetical protein